MTGLQEHFARLGAAPGAAGNLGDLLISSLGCAQIPALQSQGVMATVKHFVLNNQEINRTLTSANVDERTQWEIYYPAFQAAVDEGVASAMCSYNRVNNVYACENSRTLKTDLKQPAGSGQSAAAGGVPPG